MPPAPPLPVSRLLAAAALEIAYAVFTRMWLRQHAGGVPLELATSACRLVMIPVYWVLFREVIQSRPKNSAPLRHPLLVACIAVALAIPVFFQGWIPFGGMGTALIFALTSVIVGWREELLYRAVLLNLLQSRIGTAGALLVSTALFIVYHYGAMPATGLMVMEIACMSLLLGFIYMRTGSLLAVAAIHAVYDGLWFFGPHPAILLSDGWRPLFLLTALALAAGWWLKSAGNATDAY